MAKSDDRADVRTDDFTQLNEKFIKARRDYEALLESSMSHPPQPNYQQYAIRPPQLAQGYPGGGPQYPGQGPPAQDPQRFYTPPQQGKFLVASARTNLLTITVDQPQYPPTSPSPNLQRPGATPAPFYMAGAEVPPQGGPPPNHQQYPPRDQAQRLPSGGKQPAPIQTSPPPSAQGYAPYAQPQGPNNHGPRPQSTFNNPQELSTSAYDSPVAQHNPNSAATYSSSVYSPENYDAPAPAGPSFPPPGGNGPSAPGQPPHAGYQTYTAYQPPTQPPPQAPYAGYDAAPDSAPPQPLGNPPPIPQSRPQQHGVLTPPPLHPSGPAYDSRQNLPSRMGGAGPPSAPGGGETQYKAYVPPQADAPSAPSAPNDYYRQPGGVSY